MTKNQIQVSGRQLKGTAMKTLTTLAAAFTLVVTASPSVAQDNASITVGGTAAAICTLPSSWETRTSIGGAFGTFSGTTWTIPQSSFANTDGTPVTAGGELALRITGQAFCNSAHTITLRSDNGGMHHETLTDAPQGFSIERDVAYDGHWANDSLTAQARKVGPGIQNWSPVGPGAIQTAVWVANQANGVPGARNFDLRMAVRRQNGSATTPLVAGRYFDTLTVTLTPNS